MADLESSSWDETDANNTARFPEGMAPSAVNDGARALEGAIKREWNRSHATHSSAGAASTTFTVSYSVNPSVYVRGQRFSFKAHQSCADTPRFGISGLSTKLMMKPTKSGLLTLSASDIVTNQIVDVTYDSALDQFIVTSELPQLANILGSNNTWTGTNNFGAGVTLSATITTGSTINLNVRITLSASVSTDIGAVNSNLVAITTGTGIGHFGTAAAGVWREVLMVAGITLSFSANLISPSGATSGSYVTASGLKFLATSEGSGVWRLGALFTLAAGQSTMETGTDTTFAVTAGRQHFHPSAAKAWVMFDGSQGTATTTFTIQYNVSSVVKAGTGYYIISFTNPMSTANFVVQATASRASVTQSTLTGSSSTTSFAVEIFDSVGNNANAAIVSCVVYGDM